MSGSSLVKLAHRVPRRAGFGGTLTPFDGANVPLSRGYPAVVLGVTKGGGAHTRMDIETRVRGEGEEGSGEVCG